MLRSRSRPKRRRRTRCGPPIVASGFGRHKGEVLVTNQGTQTGVHDSSVDIFHAERSSRQAHKSDHGEHSVRRCPGSDRLWPSGRNAVGVRRRRGRNLFGQPERQGQPVRDDSISAPDRAACGRWHSLPRDGAGTAGNLFVSLNTGDIDIVSRNGAVIGRIWARSTRVGCSLTTISGSPTLLISDTRGHAILRAGPGDIVPN